MKDHISHVDYVKYPFFFRICQAAYNEFLYGENRNDNGFNLLF
jgi:hypothetical protein